ncbi:MAG: hypothetical protein EBT13_02065 [Rhodobacteraceae bacterium]|nr:hypothetical protein [Paracoccaceae bacterium]
MRDSLCERKAGPWQRCCGMKGTEMTVIVTDAGFGVQPAANQFNLEFIPLAKEKYLFAVSKQATQKREIIELLNLLKGPDFQNYVNSLAGYSAPNAGEIVSIKEGLVA